MFARRSRVLIALLGVVAGALGTVSLLSTSAPPEPSAAPTSGSLTTGEEHSPSEQRPSDLGSKTPSCNTIESELAVALRNSASEIPDAESTRLFDLAHAASSEFAKDDSTCPARIRKLLTSEMTCGKTTEVIAGGLFAGVRFEADWTADLLEGARTECTRPLTIAAQGAAQTSLRIAKALERTAKTSSDPRTQMFAWLAFGTHEYIARNAGADEIVKYIDGVLGRELRSATGDRRFVLLEAAGNGACRSCSGEIERSLKDREPGTRRVAFGAWRFFPQEAAVTTMCSGASNDPSSTIREHAAWAMRWTGTSDKERVDCLLRVAVRDPNDSVRVSAAASLTHLAETSSRAEQAVIALASNNVPEDAQRVAREHLSAKHAPMLRNELALHP